MQLRQFYLQLAFPSFRVARENVEDELGAVDHSPLDYFFNIALLRRAEVVIKQNHVGVGRSGCAGDLFELPPPIKVAGSGRSRRCRISPTTSAPALSASVRSSASDSSASNSGMLGLALDLAVPPPADGIAAASRAAEACAVTVPLAYCGHGCAHPGQPRTRARAPNHHGRRACREAHV